MYRWIIRYQEKLKERARSKSDDMAAWTLDDIEFVMDEPMP